jgi:hypothetical protein
MIVGGFGVGGWCLGIVTCERAALAGREVAAVASLVLLEGLAIGAEAMLKGIEQMVIRHRTAGKSKERCACGSKDKRVRFHLWTPFESRPERAAAGQTTSTKGHWKSLLPYPPSAKER